MKKLLDEAWRRDRRGFLRILLLNVAMSLTSGISILILVPMLALLDISPEAGSAFARFACFAQRLPYETRVLVLVGAYLALILFKALLNRRLALRESAFVEDYSFDLRNRLYRSVTGADWETLTSASKTDTINLFTSQCEDVSYGVTCVIHLLSSLVSAAVQLAIALWLSVPVTLLVLAAGGAFMAVFRNLIQKSRAYGEELIRIDRAMYAELDNQLSGVKEVRTYGVQRDHTRLFEGISAEARDAQLKYVRLRAKPKLVYSIAAAVMISAVFMVCVLNFHMDTTRLVVLVYVFVRLWPVFSGLYNQLQRIQTCVPAHEKLREALDRLDGGQMSAPAADAPLSFEERIEFRGVAFAYRDSDAPVLRDVSFVLEKGSITALVGRSGAGKTTIADLLLGLLRPTSGEILIDGRPLSRENLPAWRQSMAYVPQYPLILNASVRDNLARFNPGATQVDMIAALKRAQAWNFVSGLGKGMDTLLGDQGVRLSGGERQRVVLARALLGRPRLIIMDEATSAMDYESEAAVRRAIRELDYDATVLVIAHRLATVRTAQRALVLENGVISEAGEMDEMLGHRDGYLSRLLYME